VKTLQESKNNPISVWDERLGRQLVDSVIISLLGHRLTGGALPFDFEPIMCFSKSTFFFFGLLF